MTAVQFRNTEVRLSDALAATAAGVRDGTVTLRELIAHVGEQGLLVFSAILAMPFLIPVSLPFMSTVLGLPMLLIAFAVILGRVPWIPERLLARELPAETVRHVLGRGERLVRRFEHLVRPRWLVLTGSAAINSLHGLVMAVVVLVLMAPLPFVPFANMLPAIAVILLCFGIAERDGIVILLGYIVASVSTAYIAWLMWFVVQAGMNADGIYGRIMGFFSRFFGT
jgi:hypothetical protein